MLVCHSSILAVEIARNPFCFRIGFRDGRRFHVHLGPRAGPVYSHQR